MELILEQIPWIVMPIIFPLVGSMVCFLFPGKAKLLGLLTALVVLTCVTALGWQLKDLGSLRYHMGG